MLLAILVPPTFLSIPKTTSIEMVQKARAIAPGSEGEPDKKTGLSAGDALAAQGYYRRRSVRLIPPLERKGLRSIVGIRPEMIQEDCLD
jgi:hypothetical protein